MEMDEHYKKGDVFFRVSFDVSMQGKTAKEIMEVVLKMFGDASNIHALECEVVLQTPRLIIEKESTIQNTSLIKLARCTPMCVGSLFCSAPLLTSFLLVFLLAISLQST